MHMNVLLHEPKQIPYARLSQPLGSSFTLNRNCMTLAASRTTPNKFFCNQKLHDPCCLAHDPKQVFLQIYI